MGRLEVQVIEARDLPKGHFGTPVPYAVVKVEKDRHRTHAGRGQSPVWNETFQVEVAEDHCAKLEVEIYYHHRLMDRLVGTCQISLKGLAKGVCCDEWYTLQKSHQPGISEVHIALTALNFGELTRETSLASLGPSASRQFSALFSPPPAPYAAANSRIGHPVVQVAA